MGVVHAEHGFIRAASGGKWRKEHAWTHAYEHSKPHMTNASRWGLHAGTWGCAHAPEACGFGLACERASERVGIRASPALAWARAPSSERPPACTHGRMHTCMGAATSPAAGSCCADGPCDIGAAAAKRG